MADVRLIDANVLPNYKCQVTATIGDRKGPAEMRFVFWQDIEKAPAIDAVPVVHGQWLRENIRPKSYFRVCSMCKKTAYFCGEGCSYKYCPYCGAKMDGGAKDDV